MKQYDQEDNPNFFLRNQNSRYRIRWKYGMWATSIALPLVFFWFTDVAMPLGPRFLFTPLTSLWIGFCTAVGWPGYLYFFDIFTGRYRA